MKVVSLAPMWRDELGARLSEGITLVSVDRSDAERVAAELGDAAVVLTTRFDREMARACRALQLIVCPAAGTEGIDRDAVPPGVEILNGVGHETPMAEYVIGALVALRQRFLEADRALRRGTWRFGYFGDGQMVDELRGSTLGIVGFGRIGEQVARRANAFGMRCRAVTLHADKPIEGGLLAQAPGSIARPQDVDDLVAMSDAVVIACEHSSLTHGLIDSRRLASMRRTAVLVNVARGPIVDERALFDALKTSSIAGAAIDVWYRYPEDGARDAKPSAYPFETLENVLMTPHSSGWTSGAKARKLAFLSDAINGWYENRRPR